MKKTICWLGAYLMMCFTMVTSACAQNESYKELMVRMAKAGNSSTNGMSVDNMKTVYTMVATEAIGEKHADWTEEKKNAIAAELVEKYIQERAFEDMVGAMSPYFEKNMSVNELKEYVTVCENERFQELNRKITSLSQASSMTLLSGVMVMAQGKELQKLTPVACADSYKQAFKTYYDNSGTISVLDQLAASLSTAMKQSGGDEAQIAEIFNKMMTYMKNNLETVLLNSYVAGGISEEDLNYFAGIVAMPVYKSVVKSTQDMMGDIMGFSQNIMVGFATWLEGQEF